jgi:hypothetical protein
MVGTGFWAYRAEQESLGKANGVQPFATKAFYAGVSGRAVSNVAFETLYDLTNTIFVFEW